MTCAIIEDEPLARERLKNYISKTSDLKLSFIAENGIEATQLLRKHSVDIIFLDIHMPGISGIALLEKGITTAAVVITTAHHEFAVKGFELDVTDYLLKPFGYDRFLQAVEKAKYPRLPKDQHFFVKTEYRLEKILYSDLLYIEGMRDYRKLHTKTKTIMTLQTFRDFEYEIPASKVCRVHKSFMVSIENISSFSKSEIIINKVSIPVSETYRENFFKNLGRKF
ncbi:response regulator transcription factor [Pollutibacter soli]|uniref:LytR/AlgR family response regulator transcription factor n=1 Tax=Pollutibacter soli TaxID=3034157 RepID=UPI0030138917